MRTNHLTSNSSAIQGWCSGGRGNAKLVEALVDQFVVDVKSIHNFIMDMNADHGVFAWGNNTYDELGNDGNEKSHMSVKVIINTTARVSCFLCAHSHSMIRMEVPETSLTPAMLSTTRFENATAIDSTKDADTVDE
ncbi:hypothetical protein BWQ96_09992 [Gracilariopsis chorda]|uniref:Uncharacterized protein n=1 Tax=Gracilariopsis chorda TaxID=448386 RepID=A0A2V3IGM9_9FLOR|nr:hypothetical protein BWQ96_09992 [Gracilariopsis chorda]|eukprot:PXF40300.1 hypothetical protein BWQ96_09992 [Gracilariopsis chorda]